MSMEASLHLYKAKRHIIIMGVSGCGKSTIGAVLANKLGLGFAEGDELHPATNIEKMRNGAPLDDNDRWPWLARICDILNQSECLMVVSCSALKKSYRDFLRRHSAAPVDVIYLRGSFQTISSRLTERSGHFMPSNLLQSQFDILEEPEGEDDTVIIDIELSLESIIEIFLTK